MNYFESSSDIIIKVLNKFLSLQITNKSVFIVIQTNCRVPYLQYFRNTKKYSEILTNYCIKCQRKIIEDFYSLFPFQT